MRLSEKLVRRLCTVWVWLLFAVCLATAQSVAVGYTELKPGGNNVAPAGSAIFSYRNAEGVLVSEAGVAAVRPIKRGRIFVDGGARTGLAIVNPQPAASMVNLSLRDSSGQVVNQSTLVLEAGRHTARFVDQIFNNIPVTFRGSLTFESGTAQAAITLRESRNGYLEPVYTTLPVIDLDEARTSEPLTFPQLAVGGGYQTEVVLMNGGSAPSKGRIRFFGSDGLPLPFNLDSLQTSELPYEIAPDGIFRTQLSGADSIQVGYAVLTPETGPTPSGSIIFKLFLDGRLASETGVGATAPTKAAKILIDNVGRQTGFALANPGSTRAELKISLQDRFGVLQREVYEVLPPGGHLSKLAHEFFPSISAGFVGFLEIRSSAPVVPITLQITTNSRGIPLFTTLPVADLAAPALSGDFIFPQVAVGGPLSTRFVLMATEASEFTLFYHTSDSLPWSIGPGNSSSVQFRLAAGQGVRSFPGSDARIASVSVRDPSTNLPTSEISVTAGSTARPIILVVDTLGNAREDFPVEYVSLTPNVAAVRSDGLVTGLTAGFSTLVVSGGGQVATATVSVVSVERPSGAFAIGVAQNAAGTLFVTTEDQTLLKVEKAETTLYAGTHRQAGFRNDVRLLSQFNAPSSLAVDRLTGRLYVSDSGNHAIRVVPPGTTETVSTLNGRGTPGFADGPAGLFNTPKGVAIDNAGFVWVVDQGNHVIRRIQMATGEVRTVAGSPGQVGNRDGVGSAARFDTPTGIAVEPESLVEQLLREARHAPPPPVRVLVTDTKNGIIRRITENGEVSTLRSGAAVSAMSNGPGQPFRAETDGTPLTFNSPTGIAVGPLGTIYVTESAAGQVRSILPTGEVVTISSPGSFDNPTGIVIGKDGEIIVASTGTPLTAIRASAPVITSITPDNVDTGGGQVVEVRGQNFERDGVLVIAQTPIRFTFYNTTRISFVAPALPAGQTSLSLTTRGGVGVAAFRVGPAISLTFGAIVQGEITQAGQINRVPFTAREGDRVLVTLVTTSGFSPFFGRNPRASVTSPSGRVIGAWDATAEREFTLPETGTYTVDVFANNFVDTGKYNLGLERLDGATGIDASIGFGGILTGKISLSGENGLFTFSGSVGDRVLVTLVTTSGFSPFFGSNPRASLLTPSGQALGTFWDATDERDFTLPETGVYLVRVRANNLADTGTYSLGLERLRPVTAADATVIFGTIFNGKITQAAQNDLITFAGNANDRVLLTLTTTSGFSPFFGRNPRASLLAPSGQALGTFWDATNEQEFILPETGVYLVRVRANNLADTGDYSLGLERLRPITAVDATFGFGTTVSGRITNATQQDLITFTAAAGDRIQLVLVTTSGFSPFFGRNPRATLTSPSGQVLGTWDATGSRDFTLAEAGTYLVRVRANNLTDSGTYNLSLIKLGP